MPSFDVVSQLDLQELDNAINITQKGLATRYDFRGSKTDISFDKKGKKITLLTEDDMKMTAIRDMMISSLIKRKIEPKCLEFGETQAASGGMIRKVVTLREGIDKESAKKIVKIIKDANLKVQAAIMDDQVRVTGKKIDDLQEVIALLRAADLPVALQFTNMKN